MNFALHPGDKIGVIAPSRWLKSPQDLDLGIKYLQDKGLTPILGPNIFKKWRYMAGTVEERVSDIMEFYKSPDIKAIFCVGGGDGSQFLLPHLDYDTIKNNPKPIFGHSDNNALQLGIMAMTGQVEYTGFVLVYDFRSGRLEPITKQSLEQIFNGQKTIATGGECVIRGQCEGRLIGGCLSLFRNLCGTPYFPDLSGSILLFEDEEEPTYKLDLMLQQISQQKGFDQVRGIVFGQFTDIGLNHPDDKDVNRIIDDFAAGLKIPVIRNFPFGHVRARQTVPVGAVVELDAERRLLKVKDKINQPL